jgi:hypothetical protein
MKRVLFLAALLLLATTTPLFAETLRWTNVRDYGAECNGNYDDTSAFSRGDRRSPIGGDVFVPPGNAS